MRKIFAIVILLSLAACQKDDTIQYFNVTMGNFTDGKFISDQGNIFNITEKTCNDRTDTLKRAIVMCDILTKRGENSYDVRLNEVTPVFTKSPVDSTAVTDSAVFVENPLNIGELWISGGYINMYIVIPMKVSSTQAHLINLMLDDEASSDGVYRYTLKHNAYGEVPSSGDTDFVLGGTYVSFPVSGKFNEEKATIHISWTSLKSDEYGWSTETEKNTLQHEWARGGFEQSIQ